MQIHREKRLKGTTGQLSKPLFAFPKILPTIPITTSLERDDAYGSFTPTTSAFPSLQNFVDSNPPSPSHSVSSTRMRYHSMFEWGHTDSDYPPSESSSIPGSPKSLFDSLPPSVPSISRTSSYADSGVAPSSSAHLVGCVAPPLQPPKTKMHPILFALEKNSRLSTRGTSCATCGKLGSNYPRCGKCGEMWCSRPCRTRNGQKHVCARTLI